MCREQLYRETIFSLFQTIYEIKPKDNQSYILGLNQEQQLKRMVTLDEPFQQIVMKNIYEQDWNKAIEAASEEAARKMLDLGMQEVSHDFRRKSADGFRWNQYTYKYFLENDNVIIILFIKDVHEKKRAEVFREQILSKALEETEEASEAKTDFLSRISHEVRIPMNTISGMILIADKMIDDKKQVQSCLQKIEEANQHLLGIVNDILDVAKIESGQMEIEPAEIDFIENLDVISTMMYTEAKSKDVSYQQICEFEQSRTLLLDKPHFNQILIHIIGNAIKFTDEGGKVSCRIAKLREDEKSVTLHFSIKDTGIGMTHEQIGRVFEVFKHADKKIAGFYNGSGLGLAISNRLIQMMGGKLEVKSEKGKGSEFYFDLEFSLGDHLHKMKNDIEQPEKALKGKRILVAEDNDLNREMLVALLEMGGALIETCTNGKDTMEEFMRHDPYYYDAILMDIRMPVMDGYEATDAIRKSPKKDGKTIPIVAMTANAFEQDGKISIKKGMNGHLNKPISIDEVRTVLENLWIELSVQKER